MEIEKDQVDLHKTTPVHLTPTYLMAVSVWNVLQSNVMLCNVISQPTHEALF